MFIVRRLKINHDSHEFILEFGTVAKKYNAIVLEGTQKTGSEEREKEVLLSSSVSFLACTPLRTFYEDDISPFLLRLSLIFFSSNQVCTVEVGSEFPLQCKILQC
jgi:hypothetical protein